MGVLILWKKILFLGWVCRYPRLLKYPCVQWAEFLQRGYTKRKTCCMDCNGQTDAEFRYFSGNLFWHKK